MASILIADDHALVRESVAGQLAAHEDLQVVGQTSNAANAVDAALELKPDVVIMDIDMPGVSCFSAARTILLRCPDTKIIFLSAHQHDGYIDQAIKARAHGYVLKSGDLSELIAAIRTVLDGKVHYSESVLCRLVISGDSFRLDSGSSSVLGSLTGRERELLQLLARGLSVREAAEVMNVSQKTVDNQKYSIMKKLDIHDRVELARYAIREGIVAP